MVSILESIMDTSFENKDEICSRSFKDLGLDSLDCLEYMHYLKDKFDKNLPSNIDSDPLSLTINQLVGFFVFEKIS
jgi:acyl carrier protein